MKSFHLDRNRDPSEPRNYCLKYNDCHWLSIASYSRPEIVVLDYSFVIHDGSWNKTFILFVGRTCPYEVFTVDGVKVTKESGLLYPNSFVPFTMVTD